MSDAFSSVSIADLVNIHGGQQPPPVPAPSTLSIVGQGAKKVVPVLKAIDAGHAGVTGYNRARAAGDNIAESVGTGVLDAGNRLSFGLLNWVTGRR